MFNPINESSIAETPSASAWRQQVFQAFVKAALSFWLWAGAASVLAGSSAARTRLEYNRDVWPILSDYCFACHGPDKNQRKGKLRLDVREAALEKEAIVPGKPNESGVVKRIFTTDADDLMPPPEMHKELTS